MDHYLPPLQCHALIYMVDGTSDRDRLNESKEELRNILLDKRMKCKPLLVLCNKYDTRECIGPNSLIDAFSLSQMLLDSLDNGENVTGMSEPKVRVVSENIFCIKRFVLRSVGVYVFEGKEEKEGPKVISIVEMVTETDNRAMADIVKESRGTA